MNASYPRFSRHRAAAGVVLLEALIAMLIFAFGVLGLVGLQAAMTQAQTSSKFRADAAILATDLFGLVQTDNFANLGLYSTAGCSAHPRCADWLAKVEATLPEAEVSFTTSVGTGRVEIAISWQQGGQDRNSYNSSMVWQQ
jgi:type IV pilus assembly protein PilV